MSQPAHTTQNTVHITLRDTPTGDVAVHSSFKPAVGNPASPAQSLALDMLRITPRQWPVDYTSAATPAPGQRAPLIYISGPMTDVPAYNHPAFHMAALALRAAGWQVFNPAENGMPDEAPWAEHMRVDIKRLMDCTHVATLPGYLESRGAMLEVHIATRLGLQVGNVEYWLAQGTAGKARALEAAA